MDTQDVLTPPHGLKCIYEYSIYMVTCIALTCMYIHVVWHFNQQRNILTTDKYDCVRNACKYALGA